MTRGLKMYQKFGESNQWQFEILNYQKQILEVVKEAFKLQEKIFSSLKYESGVHRVQRVPQTETQGGYIHQLPL